MSGTTHHERPWLSSYGEGVPSHVAYDEIFLSDFLERSVERFPHKTALNFQGFKLSYRETDRMIKSMAAWLTAIGVTKGDRVAILLPNLIPCMVGYYAILRVGGVAVMNNPLYTDRELLHQFNDSGARVLITLDLLADRMVALRDQTAIREIVYTSIGDYLPFPKNLLFALMGRRKKMTVDVTPAPDLFKWTAVVDRAPSEFSESLDLDDVAMCQYTGGTTGLAKGVMLTHRNLSFQIQQAKVWFSEFREGGECCLCALPWFHIFGITCALNYPVAMGWEMALVPKPGAPQLLAAIRKFRPTFLPLVPTMYIGMLNDPAIDKTDMTSIKASFSGSAPLPVEITREFERRSGAIIVEGFGMTEASPVTHMNPFSGGPRKVGSIGVPVPDTDARVVDLVDGTRPMAVGEIGEMVLKGPQVMKGYHNRPDTTAETLVDGWLHTGDIARMDGDGYFYIVDRKKDMILSGGYNVYPREIEDVIYEHPKVQEVCAIGIPHAHRGEAVKVFVVMKRGETATEVEMLTFCSDKLAKYKWPVAIAFCHDLPKSTVGKILRKDLRAAEAQTGRGTSRV